MTPPSLRDRLMGRNTGTHTAVPVPPLSENGGAAPPAPPPDKGAGMFTPGARTEEVSLSAIEQLKVSLHRQLIDRLDLEALERMTADPTHAAETLVSLCPVVFRSHWATLVDASGHTATSEYATTLAPDLTPEIAARFAPFDSTHRTDLASGCTPKDRVS